MLRSVWSVWFDTNQGAFVIVLRIFYCDRCKFATLDLLAHLHSSIPYVQMGLITVLYTSNLFYNDKVEFLPISQIISFAFQSVCFLFLAMCSFQFSLQ
jgi:hypothetical protein